jgi:hypothetical protein
MRERLLNTRFMYTTALHDGIRWVKWMPVSYVVRFKARNPYLHLHLHLPQRVLLPSIISGVTGPGPRPNRFGGM